MDIRTRTFEDLWRWLETCRNDLIWDCVGRLMSNRGTTFVRRTLLSFSREGDCNLNLGQLRYHVVGPVTCHLRTKAKQFWKLVPQLYIRERKTSERRVFLKALGVGKEYVYWETCDVEYFVWTIDCWSLRHLRLATTHLQVGSVGNIMERSVIFYIYIYIYMCVCVCVCVWGHAVVQFVQVQRYNPENRGFDSRRCYWNFSLTYSFGRTMALGPTQRLNINEYHEYFLEDKGDRSAGFLNFSTFLCRMSRIWEPETPGTSELVIGLYMVCFTF
jgi:hypothetical protein